MWEKTLANRNLKECYKAQEYIPQVPMDQKSRFSHILAAAVASSSINIVLSLFHLPFKY